MADPVKRMVLLPLLLASAALLGPAGPADAADRPNVVWILSEDNSAHYMNLFDETGPTTPNIERLAEQGIVFERAFSNSPVCSVARTTLATGVYAPRIATHHHRKMKPVQLPEGWRMFPAYLREAGYHTTNNRKKDYNAVEGPGVWDASSGQATWRDRPEDDMPFFHMRSIGVSHEGRLHFSEGQIDPAARETDPDAVEVFPYFPDTDLFRYTTAFYHDRIRTMDQRVGRLVEQLEADGLLEDTFIFYFGDHGGVLPGSKGYAYESGLHVPLVVRVPENWRDRVDFPAGSRTDGFVSFVDFGPTVLHLAGLDVPEHMDGQPFLGEAIPRDQVEQRDEAYGYADRFDEKYGMVRSLRKGRFKYLRNYQAFYPDGLQNNYRYRMLAYQQWRQMYHDGELNAVQRQFFERRPAEQLFDLEADPHETRNLADDPQYADVVRDLRQRLNDQAKQLPDLGFFPENVLVERAVDDPAGFAERRQAQIAELVDTADLALQPFSAAKPALEQALAADDPWQRYWALIACSVFGEEAAPMEDAARAALDDDEPLVRVRAAEFLAILGQADPRPTLYDVLATTDSPARALITLNTLVFARDTLGYTVDPADFTTRVEGGQVQRRLDYLRDDL